MKFLLNKLFLAFLLLSQALVLAEAKKPKTWREKTAQFYQDTSEKLSLGREYLGARWEMAKDDGYEKLDKFNQKVNETKNWIKKNPRKTAAAIATVIITIIAIKKMAHKKPASAPFNPGKQEEVIAPVVSNQIPLANHISAEIPQNQSPDYGYYPDLHKPNTNGTGVGFNGKYDLLSVGDQADLGTDILRAMGSTFNNLAETITHLPDTNNQEN